MEALEAPVEATGGTGGTGGGNGGTAPATATATATGNGNGGETETPANLTITSSPQITGSLLAGGSATITATVNNDGQATSATQSISVQTPTGVTVSGIDATPQASGLRRAAAPAPITCNPANTCTAQFSVAGQSSVNVTVTITATRDATGGDASVQMLGQTFALPVTVGSPVTSLTGVADGTLFADDQVHRIQVTQTVANGGPEPITFTSTSPDVRFESCPPDEASGAAVSCAPDDGGEFSLAVVIGRGQSPGPLGDIIKVVDSAGRPLNLTGADGQPLQVVTPGPANLVLAEQFTVQQPVSGGSGSFTVTVRNAGGTASATGVLLNVTLSGGISLTGSSPQGVVCADTACSLPPIDPGVGLPVTVSITASPTTSSGQAEVRLSGAESGLSIGLEVSPGITALTATAANLVADGTAQAVTVTATLAQPGIDPGPITFTTGTDLVTLSCGDGQSAPKAESPKAECSLGDDNRVSLNVTVFPRAAAGPLPLTATDAAGRTITNNNFDDLQIVKSPADLVLTTPFDVRKPVSGGTGSFALTAWNAGGTATAEGQTVDLTLSGGIRLIEPITPSVNCVAVSDSEGTDAEAWRCTLPIIDPNQRLTLGFSISALPTTTGGKAIITPTDQSAGLIIGIPVDRAITALTATAGDLVADGTPRPVTVTATLAQPGIDPGPITFTTGTGLVTLSCGDEASAPTAECALGDDSSVTVNVTINPGQPAGALPLRAADAAQRPITDNNFDELRIVAPARLVLENATQDQEPFAGGSGTITVDVVNAGGVAVPAGQSIEVDLPNGITLAGTTIPGGSCGQQPTAALAVAAPAALAVADCTLPAIDPDGRVTVGFAVHADPAATGGRATISLPGYGPGTGVTIAVRAGIAELVATADPLVADGTPHPVTVTATPADGSVTDLGQIRFDAGPDVAISCGGKPSGTTATCGFDDGTLRLDVATTVAGPLVISSVDLGGRPIENSFAELTVLAPASLSLSDLSVAQPLVAGGTGALTVTVTNEGGVDGSLGSVTLSGPEGVTVAGVTPSCEGDCIVPAGGSVEVTVTVDVAPTVRDPATLALKVGDLTTDKIQVPVASGILRVDVTPDNDLIADGSTATRTVTVVSKPTDPGPVTLIAPKGITLTACDERGPSVTCTGPTFTIGITVAPGTTPGPLALTAQDAGLRSLPVTPLTVVAPAPAELRLDVPDGVSVYAGGTGSLSVTVSNGGGSTSPGGERISVALPKGMTLTGTDILGTGCTGAAQAALAVAAPTAAVAADCTLPPIDRDTDQQVTFFFDATPGAAGGDALVTLADQKPVPVPMTVNAGITGFTPDRTTLPADGTAQTVVLAATPAAEGLDLGSITVTSDDPTVTVTCGDGGSCSISRDGTVKLSVTVSEKHGPGSLTLSVKDEGGRTFDVGPITVLGAPQLTVSELTMNVQPVQGGQGQFSLTVSNTGGSPSAGGDLVTAAGARRLSIAGVDRRRQADLCHPFKDCKLPSIAGTPVTVVVTSRRRPRRSPTPTP